MSENIHLEFQSIKKDLDAQLEGRSKLSFSLHQTFFVIRAFEQFGGALYRLRRRSRPEDPRMIAAEDYAAQVSARLLSNIKPRKGGSYAQWVARYRRIWRQNSELFLITLCIFVSMGLIGWHLGVTMPEYVAAIIPQEFMERIIQHNKWFEDLNESPLVSGLMIAYHNIQVCLMTFLAGTVLGLGGLYFIGFNGLFFGTILGFCYANEFNRPLQEFIMSHGPLELSIIVCAGFASCLYGRVFWMRPYSKFTLRMKEGVREAGTVAAGVLPWLILAGLVEGLISPNPNIALAPKVSLGAFIAMLFWLWTWDPFHSTRQLHEIESSPSD